MNARKHKSVLAISSHVARGSVGNRSVVFVLEYLGHPVWSVPTIMLPWHPGHGRSTPIRPDDEAFARFLMELGSAPWLGEIDAVITGYFGSPAQAVAVAELVGQVKSANPAALFLCDPVIGDDGGLYVLSETAAAIRDILLPIADLATPNRFELSWFAGQPLNDMAAIIDAARRLGPRRVLVTSAEGKSPGNIANLYLSAEESLLAEHRRIDHPVKGTGDLTASLFLSRLLNGLPPREALRETTAAVYEMFANAAARGADELMLETDARILNAPTALVTVNELTPTPA
ncbi:pyridoxal kinase PdxY [Nitratireductor basaltis]|uniref:pyridoxal kinase n=1 Tax=Nitratireductor basaltis TaxID=472175 RepID=A0A084U6K3_9HYPH|nr:pyridoxal kinase PdxY [Nitratireductor basaltis]KFB08589.1 Pyridoxamine kinase [Nitratireductor basaltis]